MEGVDDQRVAGCPREPSPTIFALMDVWPLGWVRTPPRIFGRVGVFYFLFIPFFLPLRFRHRRSSV